MKISKICCIGAGYVGGPTMAVIADKCPSITVTVVDLNKERIESWNSNNLPIYEPGLFEILQKVRGRNLFFSVNIETAISEADCVFISVNTPTKTSGRGAGKASDLRYLESCAITIAGAATGYTIVVEKSTLPVKSAQTVKSILSSHGGDKRFDVISNPEFLAEGSAIHDLINPDRVLIGGDSELAINAISQIYQHWVPVEKIFATDLWSSELSKLAANAYLAQRVSSINSLSAICETTDANVFDVAEAIGRDTRIGKKFLQAGPGFGGSCFQKDVLNLVYLCEHFGLPEVATYWEQVVIINKWQKDRIARVVTEKLFGNLSGKKIAILGFAFKNNTNDVRESPAIRISKILLDEGAHLIVYDPKANAKTILSALDLDWNNQQSSVEVTISVNDAIRDADAMVVITDWDEFRTINWLEAKALMKKPGWVFDTRNLVDPIAVQEAGLNYWGLGKPNARK